MKDKELSLEEMQQNFADLQKQYEELKKSSACDGPSVQQSDDMMSKKMEHIYGMMNQLYNYASRVQQNLNQHSSSSTHLPPISGPAQMNKVLKALGMDQDYAAQKRVIYAGKNDYIVEAEMSKTK